MAGFTCPKGHASDAGDYCDECGAAIGGTSRSTSSTPATPSPGSAGATGPAEAPCPACDAPRSGRFCEVCGYDFIMAKLGGTGTQQGAGTAGVAEPGAPAPAWRLVVRSDAAFHAQMEAQRSPDTEAIPFPAFCPERRFVLSGSQALIGRQSRSRGIEPEIDLSGPPPDTAVSHAHALLIAQPDGSWAVVDLDSANGTYVNDAGDPIAPNTPLPLTDGDRVHVGGWTTITIQRAT